VSERIQRRRTRQVTDDASASELTSTHRAAKAVDYDAILDEIDSVLEADAEEYVRSFVQKGGQ